MSSTYGDVDSAECSLTPAETSVLLRAASAADRTEVLDLLLTGLARALKRWTASERWVVLVESHGRDSLTRELPVEREIGWFTTLYPLALDAAGDDIAEQLLRIKLTRRNLPRRGAGYLVSNASGPSTIALTFNYFGALSVSHGDRLFADTSEWTGSPIAADLTRPYDIDVSGIVRDGQLQWTVYFHRRRLARASMERFLSYYREELLSIGEHRRSVMTQETPASDFADASETARELRVMIDRLPESGSSRERLVDEVRQAWAIPADERDWESEPAIPDMSAKLADAARFGNPLGDEMWVALNRTNAQDVFAFPPATGDLLGYLPLAQLLPQYRWSAFNYVASPDRYRVYADYVEKEAPQPAVLLGHSGGGHLAYLTAVELERRGVPVRALVMIDAGRLIAPIRFDEEEAEIVAMAFLRDQSIIRHVNTPPLRDKVRKRIRAYYQRLATETHDDVIDACIHALVAENAPASHRSDATGVIAESVDAWREITRGVFRIWRGGGDHARMLLAPHLEANAQVLGRILADVSIPSGVAS
jgi:non-ribosomal peptide synthase protein (TIGR01720 family)